MSDAQGALAGLTAEQKRAILARLMRERAQKARRFPASYAQRTLWFLQQMNPGAFAYNMHAAVRVEGPLVPEILERAINEIVRRHESLRTTFAAVDGEPMLVIAPSLALPLSVVDLRDCPESERQTRVQALAVEETRRPFDLAAGPLFRVKLLRLGDQEFVTLLTLHHINADGWSVQVFLRELAALYNAFSRGSPSPLPELPIQYADYAAWQRRRIEAGEGREALEYWRTQLAGVAPLELPTDRPRPAVLTVRGAVRAFSFPTELGEALGVFCRAQRCTPFTVLLAAFQLLLQRHSGQDDIPVGSPYANRTRAELEGLIGYFVNMLVLRTDLSGDPTFLELLARVRHVVLGAIRHQDLPFNKVVEELRIPRDLSRDPLFQVMFAYQNTPRSAINLSALRLRLSRQPIDGATLASKFELTLSMSDTRRGLNGRFQYNADLFDAATIDRMIGHFETLLRAIVDDPDRRISEIPILTEPERRHLLEVASRPAPGGVPCRPGCVHELFEAQAARAPEAEALVAGEVRLSYGVLNRRANRLAHHLRALGVGPEVLVGIRVASPVERMVCVLAVLKAGGAYLPLDPSLPRQRLATVLDDARAPVLLADGPLPPDLTGHAGHVIRLDRDLGQVVARPDDDPPPGATPENLAYVIATSGSLGRPKGVMITHASLAAAYHAWAESYELGPGRGPTRHLQMANFAFDVSTGDWVRALASGGTLVACPKDVLLDPRALFDLMSRERVDCAEFVPAVVEGLIAYLEQSGESLGFARLLAVGSDVWRAGDYERLRRLAAPTARVVSSYGLTEATIDSTFFEGSLADRPADRPVPIGRPFAHARTYVLDRHLRPVPVGVAGELHVGGPGVARGYHRQPALTAERFIPDPFADEPGSRLYKTGDLARWLPDGNLELLGRIDHQVKVRGFRVELTEVEAALLRHPDVREAAAAVADDKSLVAYLVPRPGRSVSAEALRRWLREILPRPMVPSAFLAMESLPQTPSGKVDRNALPPIETSPTAREGAAVGPRNEVERELVRIWEDLLNVRPVGVTDNFFDLGGHSLLAVRLAVRVEERFGRKLPLSAFFLGETIEELAVALGRREASLAWSPLVAIRDSGSGPPLYCVHPVGGNVACYRELSARLDGDRPVYGVQAAGLDGPSPPAVDLEAMATRYVEAIREAQPEGPYHLAGWSLGGIVAFEMARQLRALGQQVAALVLIDSRAPAPGRSPTSIDDAEISGAFLLDLARGRGERDEAPVGPPTEIDPERLGRLQEVFKANRLALAGYSPRPFDGRLILILAGSRALGGHRDPTAGWGPLATGGVTAHVVPGDHYSLLRPPAVEAVAEVIRAELARQSRCDNRPATTDLSSRGTDPDEGDARCRSAQAAPSGDSRMTGGFDAPASASRTGDALP